VQEVDRPAQPLPAGTSITEVYDGAGGALLILGEPGAGKTTLLLALARDLLIRAQADEREPIPVVFNLSSWAQKRAPLTPVAAMSGVPQERELSRVGFFVRPPGKGHDVRREQSAHSDVDTRNLLDVAVVRRSKASAPQLTRRRSERRFDS